MKKVMSIFAALVVIVGLCFGCGTTDKPEPEVPEQPQESNVKKWEPETTAPSKTPSVDGGHDHSDHSGHSH